MSPGGSAPSGQEGTIAKITALPNREIIDKYKGKLDFYTHRGLFCVRKWPLHPPRAPYPTEGANQDLFAYIMHLSPTLPANIKTLYQIMAQTKYFRWQDYLVRGYISGFHYLGISYPYGLKPATLPRFYLKDLNFIWLGDYLTIEWETDVDINCWVILCRDAPDYIELPKYRRGALWYLDHKISLYSRASWNQDEPYHGFHHQLTLRPVDLVGITWICIGGRWSYDDIDEMSPSDTPPIPIPPSPWTP